MANTHRGLLKHLHWISLPTLCASFLSLNPGISATPTSIWESDIAGLKYEFCPLFSLAPSVFVLSCQDNTVQLQGCCEVRWDFALIVTNQEPVYILASTLRSKDGGTQLFSVSCLCPLLPCPSPSPSSYQNCISETCLLDFTTLLQMECSVYLHVLLHFILSAVRLTPSFNECLLNRLSLNFFPSHSPHALGAISRRIKTRASRFLDAVMLPCSHLIHRKQLGNTASV